MNNLSAIWQRGILLCLWISFSPSLSPAQKIIVLNDSINSMQIRKYIYTLRDSKAALSIYGVTLGNAAKHFISSSSLEYNFGHTSDIVWVRFTVKNQSSIRVEWLLSEEYSIIDKVTLFSPTGTGNYKESNAGVAYPMNEREVKNRLTVFPLYLNPS